MTRSYRHSLSIAIVNMLSVKAAGADAEFQRRMRQLLVQANRNSFLYALDCNDGRLQLATPFV